MNNHEGKSPNQSELNLLNLLKEKEMLLREKDNKIKQYETKILGLNNKIQLLTNEAYIDHLTGLYTRKELERKIGIVYSRIKKPDEERRNEGGIEHFSMLFIDIDNFKAFNTKGGQQEGDRMLRIVAQLLQDNVRQDDIVGRLGGEEMIVGLVGTTENEANQKAEELRNIIEKKSDCTISIGVTSFNEGINPQELINEANLAMIKAKATGKNRVELFSRFTEEDRQKYQSSKK